VTRDAQKTTEARRAVVRRCTAVALDVAGAGAVVFGVVDVLGRGWAAIAGGVLAMWRAYSLDERRSK
jgi:hypothetical protein